MICGLADSFHCFALFIFSEEMKPRHEKRSQVTQVGYLHDHKYLSENDGGDLVDVAPLSVT